MIGLVMLMGLVTKNAILLVDFANHARKAGATVADAVLQSAFRTVIEWLRQRSRAQRSLTAKRSTLLCAGAKSSTHEWPRTARHGADHVCPGPGEPRSHAHGFAPA
jgi:hypothetical protein